MTRILDIDLDFFVKPTAYSRGRDDPRLPDDQYSVSPHSEVTALLKDKWRISTDIPFSSFEHHDEIIDLIQGLVDRGELGLPICWIHLDAHDDFSGHFSNPINFGNFMYEVVRREWCDHIVWVYPDWIDCQFPTYIYNSSKGRVEFDDFKVPIDFMKKSEFEKLTPELPPDYLFLCRSPAFTPPKADALFQLIHSFALNAE